MAINATAFKVAKDVEQEPGTLLFHMDRWYLRARLTDGGKIYEGAMIIAGDDMGEFITISTPTSCLGLVENASAELCTIGRLEGPGEAPTGSLCWDEQGVYFVGGTGQSRYAVTPKGGDADHVAVNHTYFCRSWGVWVCDDAGNRLGEDPLFTVEV